MKLIHWLGWVAAAIMVVLVYQRDLEIAALGAVRKVSVPAPPPPVAAPAPSPILAPPPATTDASPEMLSRIAELETQLTEARTAAEAATEEAARYRSGLENAVAELNHQGRPDGPRRAAAPAAPPPSPASNVRIWTPETSHVGNDLVVAGKVHNLGAEATAGSVIVEVYDGSGELVGEDRVDLTLEGRSLGDYYVRMPVPPRELTVKARWESS